MKVKWNTYGWLLIPIALVFSCIITICFVRSGIESDMYDQVYSKLEITAENESKAFAKVLDGQYNILDIFADKASAEGDFSSLQLQNSMETFTRNSAFVHMGLAGTDLTGYDELGKTVDLSDRNFAKQCLKGQRVIEYINDDQSEGENVFVIAVPIMNNDKTIGITYGVYDETMFYEYLISDDFAGVEYTFISDADGNILGGSFNMPVRFRNENLFKLISDDTLDHGFSEKKITEDFSKRESGSFAYTAFGQHFNSHYLPISIADWYIIVSLPTDYLLPDVNSSELFFTTVIIVIFAIFIIFAVLFRFYLVLRHKRVEEKNKAELERLSNEARKDPVTGLLNYESGFEEVEDFLSQMDESIQLNALFLIELLNIKEVFEEDGYEEGNKVLIDSANVIKRLFHSTDILCCRGNNQFMLLVKSIYPEKFVFMRAAELCEALRFIHVGKKESLHETRIVGIAGISLWKKESPKSLNEMISESESSLSLVRENPDLGYEVFGNNLSEIEDVNESMRSFSKGSGFNVQIGSLLDNMDGGLILGEIGDPMRAIYVSPSYFKLPGSLAKDMILKEGFEEKYLGSDSIQMIKAASWKCANSGEQQEVIYKTKSERWRHVSILPFKSENEGHPIVLAVVTDISNMQQEVLEGKYSQKKMELLLDMSRLVFFEVDLSSHKSEISSGFLEKFGWDEELCDNIPQSVLDEELVHPDSIDAYCEMYEAIFRGEESGSTEVRFKNLSENRYIRMNLSWKMVYNDHSKAMKAVGVGDEITESSDSGEIAELASLQQKLAIQEKYFERAQQYQQELRKYRHDRKNNLVAINGFLNKNDIDGAKKYLKGISDILTADALLVNTENSALDALISEKLHKAKNLGIDVEHTVGIAPDTPIDQMDFCLAVGCCLDNAIESCERSREKTDKLFINLWLIEKRGVITFKMENTSAIPPIETEEENIYKSHKPDGQNHGFGLKNLAATVEKYRGYMELKQIDEMTFSTNFTLFTT